MLKALNPIDIIIIAAFLAFQLYFGSTGRRRPGDKPGAIDYLIGSRRLTLPAFVMTLVSTWYGGVLGVGEYSYKYGISNWLVFGVPYYLWAAVFALFLARRARRTQFISLPDHLAQSYGKAPAVTAALIVFVMTVPSAYVLQFGIIMQFLWNWPLWWGVTLGAVLSVGYILIGGFRADVQTNKLQFLAMFGGFALFLPFALSQLGGWSYLTSSLPASYFTWHGGNSGWYILSWYFIAMDTLIDPAFYQRCYAAESEKIARKGILWSIPFWIVFDFLTTSAGLYARAACANLPDAQMSYPALAFKILPPGVMGLFFIGMLATVMSTINSFTFLAAIAMARDVVCRLKPVSDRAVIKAMRWGLLASMVLSIILALGERSVIALWRDLGSIGTPALLLPVSTTFLKQPLTRSGKTAMWWIAVPGGISAVWVIWHAITGHYPLGVEPIFPGLAVSVGMAGVMWAGRTKWTKWT
jgi:SSS family solute:Na+ symporter